MDEDRMAGFVFDGGASNADGGMRDGGGFSFGGPDEEADAAGAGALDGGATGFPEVEKLLEDKESPVFNNPAYYKSVFEGGGDQAKRLHAVFQKYVQAKEAADKALYRQQMTNAFWEYVSCVVKESGQMSEAKMNFIRFGMLYPNALSPEYRSFFARIMKENALGQPIYYLDEWFQKVGGGDIKASASDEASGGGGAKGNENAHLRTLLEKATGKFEGARGLLRTKDTERLGYERDLGARVAALTTHQQSVEFPEIKACYSDGQKSTFNEIQELLKNMSRTDREMSRLLAEFQQSKEDVNVISSKLASSSDAQTQSIDLQALDTEYNSLRQMAKMTIGRQGNPFPLLVNDYFHSMPDNVGFRENIIRKLAWVEEADCEAFIRMYKNNPNRIVPYVLLIPSYGDYGICWEPFDKLNKATSRGRIAIPMYPKNLSIAVLTAVADFRWQVAKEIASMYWMEEGLTGNYFQWFQAQKLKGDVKLYFIQDYIAWMTKEREGVQKLDKVVRGIFWRFLPFAQPLKDKLKDRNLVYLELYQRDKNRAKSAES
jgi:hypothetical protein